VLSTNRESARAVRPERPVAGRQSAAIAPEILADPTTAPRAILEALGSLPDGRASRKAIAALAGYSSLKSTIRNALSALRIRGLIESTGDSLTLTPAARLLLGPQPTPKTSAETIAMWRSKIRHAAPVAILDALVASYPQPLTRDELGARTGVDAAKSTMRNALSQLRVQGIIDESESGVAASETLFPSGAIAAPGARKQRAAARSVGIA
jgi:hypothetical protein